MEDVEWDDEAPAAGEWLRVSDDGPDAATLWSPGFDRLGTAQVNLNGDREGVLHAVSDPDGTVQLRYRGPNDWLIQAKPST